MFYFLWVTSDFYYVSNSYLTLSSLSKNKNKTTKSGSSFQVSNRLISREQINRSLNFCSAWPTLSALNIKPSHVQFYCGQNVYCFLIFKLMLYVSIRKQKGQNLQCRELNIFATYRIAISSGVHTFVTSSINYHIQSIFSNELVVIHFKGKHVPCLLPEKYLLIPP